MSLRRWTGTYPGFCFLPFKQMFIQVLKIYLTDFYRKKKITDDLFKKILLIQENVSVSAG